MTEKYENRQQITITGKDVELIAQLKEAISNKLSGVKVTPTFVVRLALNKLAEIELAK